MYGDEIFRDKYEATSYVALPYSLEVEAKRTGGNFKSCYNYYISPLPV